MILITGFLLLATFLIHVFWWRVNMPVRTIVALLSLFFSVMLMISIIAYTQHVPLDRIVQFALFYFSSALVYIILYTAIEHQSPTLCIIDKLHSAGKAGCAEAELYRALAVTEETERRLQSLENSHWVAIKEDRIFLTQKGELIARVFHCTARLFGLNLGG